MWLFYPCFFHFLLLFCIVFFLSFFFKSSLLSFLFPCLHIESFRSSFLPSFSVNYSAFIAPLNRFLLYFMPWLLFFSRPCLFLYVLISRKDSELWKLRVENFGVLQMKDGLDTIPNAVFMRQKKYFIYLCNRLIFCVFRAPIWHGRSALWLTPSAPRSTPRTASVMCSTSPRWPPCSTFIGLSSNARRHVAPTSRSHSSRLGLRFTSILLQLGRTEPKAAPSCSPKVRHWPDLCLSMAMSSTGHKLL